MPNESELKAEIGHVLLIDIVGYSKLLINQQGELLQTLKRLVQETTPVRSAKSKRSLIRLATGDGMALVFRNDLEAPVECALQLGAALRQHPEVPLRMGIHSGPIREVLDVNERTNVTGAGIDVAQRVMDCGDAGHILLSKHVADDLAPYPRWNPYLHDLGETKVKHGAQVHLFNLYADEVGNPARPSKLREKVDRPVTARHSRLRWTALACGTLLLLSLGAAAWWLAARGSARTSEHKLTKTTPAIPEKSIAVLPFENLSSEKENAYFAEGIQAEILTRLSKIADLKVISHTSTQHYKSAPENVPEIAKEFGVAHIVEGSVQKSGDTVRVNVQLIKAANDSHLWADTLDRKLTDIFAVESEVAKSIADQLQAKLTGREESIIRAEPTANPGAYDAYLRGLSFTLQPGNTPAISLGAQRYLREAVRLDPKFALAWALLARVDSGGYITSTLQRTPALREEARDASDKALALQPDLGEALYAKGYYYYGCLKDYDSAIRYIEQARQLLPNSSELPEALAYIARRRGEWVRSNSYFDEAERLDPRNVRILTQHGLSYGALRRFSEAYRKLDQVLEITPGNMDTLATKAGLAQAAGDLSLAAKIMGTSNLQADNPTVLEIQIRQAILERRPASIIPRLKEIVAKPTPALGFFNAEIRFYLGWAQQLAGDHAAAHESWQLARSELEGFLKEQPDDAWILADLALTSMGLGERDVALSLAERGIAANPVERDAVLGPAQIEMLGRVATQTGETDRAIAALEKALSMPYVGWTMVTPLTPALLRLDPMFDPLRNDRRFQKLAGSPTPSPAERDHARWN